VPAGTQSPHAIGSSFEPVIEGPFISTAPLQIGKYLVSPLIRPLGLGRYAASVSIRSGRGSATHDRVMRLSTVFASADAATRHATAHGLAWIDAHPPAGSLSTSIQPE